MHTQISHEVSSVRGSLTRALKEKEMWWTVPDFDLLEKDDKKSLIQVRWQIKELNRDSKVMFNYLAKGEKKFREIPAEEKTGALFQVNIPVSLPLEPLINIHYRHDKNKAERHLNIISNKENKYKFEYYISIQDNEKIRSSKKYYYNLKQLSYQLFYPLHLNLFDTGENGIEISIVERIENQRNKTFSIEEIHLQSRNKSGVVKNWPTEQFVPPEYNGKDKYYRTGTITIGDDESLYMLIDYSQGLTVEKKINIIK